MLCAESEAYLELEMHYGHEIFVPYFDHLRAIMDSPIELALPTLKIPREPSQDVRCPLPHPHLPSWFACRTQNHARSGVRSDKSHAPKWTTTEVIEIDTIPLAGALYFLLITPFYMSCPMREREGRTCHLTGGRVTAATVVYCSFVLYGTIPSCIVILLRPLYTSKV